ncbi:MAG: hypothetical protein RLZ51_1201, partial [Pseudomonadota bacterium]
AGDIACNQRCTGALGFERALFGIDASDVLAL